MSLDPLDFSNDPVARGLAETNRQLRAIGDQLWEQQQPAEVQAARAAERSERNRATVWGVRLVLGIGAAWLVLSLLFGSAGTRLLGRLLGFGWDALGVLFVVGAALWVGRGLWRVVTWILRRSDPP